MPRAPRRSAGSGAGSNQAPPARARTRAPGADRQQRRQQILEAARTVFAKRGYHQTTIEHIVAEAGVARGTFYLYFEDKRSVFAELIDRFSNRISMAISSIIVDDEQRSVADQTRANIRAIITLALQEREMTKILFSDAVGLDPGFDRKLYSFYDEVVQLLTESLRQGQRLGIVRDGEPRVLAYLTIGALKELLSQVVTLGLSADSAEVLSVQLYDFLSQGYLRVEPPAAAKPAAAKKPKRSR